MQSPPDDPRVVVMKFGGSSVADEEKLDIVAAKVAQRAKTPGEDGRLPHIVVVVSAMGKSTNALVAQAKALCDPPSARELDMLLSTGERHSMALLAMAIEGNGAAAISLTGSQCGIITDHRHGRAHIVDVRPFRIQDELDAGRVVVVGGFQGVSYKREVTTLGRGGSDTTAVALAAALGGSCEIYSDVDGVYSSDPRLIEGAQHIDVLDHDSMRALSRAGARVLHSRAVALAQEAGISIYCRATRGSEKQTVIRLDEKARSGVTAVALDPHVALISLDTDSMGLNAAAAAGLRYLSVRNLGDDASGSASATRRVEGVLSFSANDDAQITLDRLDTLGSLRKTLDLALISCIGTGLEEETRLWAEAAIVVGTPLVAAFSDANTLAFAVAASQGEAVCQALHERFMGG